MTLQEFISQNTGQIIGNTPENMGQCVGLISCWMDTLNIPHEFGNAKDLLNDANLDYVTVVLNTPDNTPASGDIMVWGTQVGEFGHTAVFVSGDVNTFTSFDQNWPLNSPCHLQDHNYSGVLGWLHPKTLPVPAVVSPEPSTPNTSDETNALNVLRQAYQGLAAPDGSHFGNLEGLARELVADYPAYLSLKNAPKPSPTPPTKVTVPVSVSPTFSNPLAKLFYSIAQALG